MDFPSALLAALGGAERVAALTGAGVSQESGLRTFRDPQSGIWAKYRPEDLASPEAFRRNPRMVWDWYAWRRLAIEGVRPNAGHYALVEMASHIVGFTLITQNVDGLHAAAGIRAPIELHGNIRRVRCSDCGARAEEWDDSTEETPRCTLCGGLLRPDVVWFGEPLPRAELEHAIRASTQCQVFLSIGTSAIVQPAASLPYAARRAGAIVIEINAESTPLTAAADFSLRGRSGEILPALVKALWQ
jgi:NAD-dependent deacetylase